MSKFTLLILVVLLSPAVAQPHAPAAANNAAAIRSANQCIKPWLQGLDYIISHDSVDKDPQVYKDILSNDTIIAPIVYGEHRAAKRITSVPRPSMGTIGVIPICSIDTLPQVWKDYLRKSKFIAEYQSDDSIILRGDLPAPTLLRGLVLLHEMRHGLQARYPLAPEGTPGYSLLKEVDAYEFEFKVLDHVNPPGYQSLLADEVVRIKNAGSGAVAPNTTDPRLQQIFPGLGNGVDRKIVGTEMLIRAMFKHFELDFPPAIAHQKKLNFMTSLGYH